MIALLAAIANLIAEALKGRKTDEQVALELLDHAFASGVPASILLRHLSEKGKRDAELAADIAQFLKTGGR